MLEVLTEYHHAKFGGARISPAAEAAKNVEFLVHGQVTIIFVVSVCLFVMVALWNRADHYIFILFLLLLLLFFLA